MLSELEFINYIDDLIPEFIQEKMRQEVLSCTDREFSFLDYFASQERARVLTIKQRISSTHDWKPATCSNSSDLRYEMFWCNKCHLRASVFEHTKTLSIVSRVHDKLPTYTPHNQYLMLTCDQALKLDFKSSIELRMCSECGIPEPGGSDVCRFYP